VITTQDFRSSNQTLLGTWLKIPAIEPAEIMAYAGFDFVVVDLEHTAMNLETAYRLISVSSSLGVLPLVRVPDHNPSLIQRVLDAGAEGILAPHVDTAADAAAIARACRFPPRGARGSGGTSRAGRWGLLPRAEYLRTGDEGVLCIGQLESEVAMHNAADILLVDGLDGVLVGAADLSLDMNVPADDPHVMALAALALTAARDAGKPCGTACGNPDQARVVAAAGYSFVVMGNDSSMLAQTARTQLTEARRKIAGDAT